jgi:RNA polymerase sigma-70 factor, ECF subfamily
LIPSALDETLNSLNIKSVEPNELVRRVLAGCSESATELANRFMPRLIILLERRLPRGRSDAEDIAQESLAKAFQLLSRFNSEYQFSTWLYTIAIRLASDFVRKEKQRPKCLPIQAIEVEPWVQADQLTPNTTVGAEDIWPLARSLLVESQYVILWLKYGENLSIQEIATVLNKTKIGVRVQLHRARKNLSEEISRMDRERSNRRSGIQ